MNRDQARTLERRHLVAMTARDSFPPLPPNDPVAEQRQAAQAWKVTTVIAAIDGIDAPGFEECMQTLGLLPSESWPRNMYGNPQKEGRPS